MPRTKAIPKKAAGGDRLEETVDTSGGFLTGLTGLTGLTAADEEEEDLGEPEDVPKKPRLFQNVDFGAPWRPLRASYAAPRQRCINSQPSFLLQNATTGLRLFPWTALHPRAQCELHTSPLQQFPALNHAQLSPSLSASTVSQQEPRRSAFSVSTCLSWCQKSAL